MSRAEELEVISLPEPYNDTVRIKNIQAGIGALLANEIPALQVDIGREKHMAGTFAVQTIVEEAVRARLDDLHAAHQYPPFAFMMQNLRVPHAKPEHSTLTRLAPHEDHGQLAVAIHKPYAGEPTKVQFGFRAADATLPELDITKPYDGPDLHSFVDTVYQGTAQLGRLTLFSQGHALINMQPAAHFFERNPDQKVGGRFTRYFMVDPETYDLTGLADYSAFTAMRRQTAEYLDYQQWRILDTDLRTHGSSLSYQRYQELRNLADQQLSDHPGAQYTYWEHPDCSMTHGVYRNEELPTTTDTYMIRDKRADISA